MARRNQTAPGVHVAAGETRTEGVLSRPYEAAPSFRAALAARSRPRSERGRDACAARVVAVVACLLVAVLLGTATARADIPAEWLGAKVVAVRVLGAAAHQLDAGTLGVPIGAPLARSMVRAIDYERLAIEGRGRRASRRPVQRRRRDPAGARGARLLVQRVDIVGTGWSTTPRSPASWRCVSRASSMRAPPRAGRGAARSYATHGYHAASVPFAARHRDPAARWCGSGRRGPAHADREGCASWAIRCRATAAPAAAGPRHSRPRRPEPHRARARAHRAHPAPGRVLRGRAGHAHARSQRHARPARRAEQHRPALRGSLRRQRADLSERAVRDALARAGALHGRAQPARRRAEARRALPSLRLSRGEGRGDSARGDAGAARRRRGGAAARAGHCDRRAHRERQPARDRRDHLPGRQPLQRVVLARAGVQLPRAGAAGLFVAQARRLRRGRPALRWRQGA